MALRKRIAGLVAVITLVQSTYSIATAFLLPHTTRVSQPHRSTSPASTTRAPASTLPVEQVRGSDKEKLLDLSVLDRAMSGPPANLRVKDTSTERLRVGIIGGGLGGLITAMDLSEAGHEVEIFEARRFAGGKVGSWVDKDGNHIEMGESGEHEEAGKRGI